MVIREWFFEVEYIEFCSCDFGCFCEFMVFLIQGECMGVVGFKIIKGECDGVVLDGLIVVVMFYFFCVIHYGDGYMQFIVDVSVSEVQCDVLFYILVGEDQFVGIMFQIFSVIIDYYYDLIFIEIGWDWDIKVWCG